MRLLPALLLLPSLVLADDYVVFDEGASPQAVLEARFSVDGFELGLEGRSDVLVNPDLSAVAGVQQIYWKVETGSVVVMTAPEMAAVDAAIQAADDASSQGLGDRACLSDSTAQDINAITADNVVTWDTNQTPFHARSFSHVGSSAALCAQKRMTAAVSLVLTFNGPSNYFGRVKLRKNGTPREFRVMISDSVSGVIPAYPILLDVGDCVSIAVDRDNGNGAVTLEPGESVLCATVVAVRDTP